jgi:hypothetical protein
MPHSNTNLARRVVCNAHQYNCVPSVITVSWMRLKENQGHPITPERLDRLDRMQMQTLPARPTGTQPPPLNPIATDHAARAPRITARIAAHLAHLKSA